MQQQFKICNVKKQLTYLFNFMNMFNSNLKVKGQPLNHASKSYLNCTIQIYHFYPAYIIVQVIPKRKRKIIIKSLMSNLNNYKMIYQNNKKKKNDTLEKEINELKSSGIGAISIMNN